MTVKILNMLLTVIAGIGVAVIVFWVLDKIASLLPGRAKERVRPYFFILPAFAVITLFLLYPALQTIEYSFANATSTAFVGLHNYSALFTSNDFLQTLLNNLLYIVFAPALIIVLGLLVATLADRLRPGAEKFSKTVIFLPMAMSALAAGVIWRFVYAANPQGQAQVGILNAFIGMFGHKPIAWLQVSAFHANTFLLMVILIWTQVGYAMVLLSAAIKGVPTDTLEAARIDGAGEGAIFFRIVVPQIRTTIITVFITETINVLKLFDIVYINTNGNFNTNILGNDFYNQLFTFNNAGYAATIVVVLMIAVIPIMIYQVRNFRAEEAAR